jgi:hypothetical protein
MQVKTYALKDLNPDPANVRTHSEKNLRAIKGSLKRFGQQKPIVIDKDGVIIAGNGTYEAAKALGWDSLEVVATGLDKTLAQAFAIADNRTGELAEWDKDGLGKILQALREDGFDIGDIGFDLDDLDEFSGASGQEEPVDYTKKIEVPIYEPKGLKPKLEELLDKSKPLELSAKIEASSLSKEEKKFLHIAAYRHAVFDYEKIAEFYAQSSPEFKALAEESALVIIDFNKAIELGFVELTKNLAEARGDAL